MIGAKNRVLSNARLKATVKARQAIEKHQMDFMSVQEVLQQKVMEMQYAQASQQANQPPVNQPVQDTERDDL